MLIVTWSPSMIKHGYWLVGLLLLAGCGVEGNWELRDVRPPEGIGSFDIAAVTFKHDNTYVARLRKADHTEISRGTYEYDDWRRVLTMRSHGVERTYTATIWLLLQMNVQSQTAAGTPLTAMMARSSKVVTPEPRHSSPPTP
jgi:hypothetical protein